MFPNPQDNLPLPPRPDLEQYRKLAKDLVKACRKGPDAVGDWAARWITVLARAAKVPDTPRTRLRVDREAGKVRDFAIRALKTCGLSDAQFVLARCHGFTSWPTFAQHVDQLTHAGSANADFEAAVDAIVDGDEAGLRRLLAANPALVRARSTREHAATLLHYVSANGVEGYRQRTPPNAVAIARVLLEAGAEVDAEADMYGGRCTALLLTATSVHPFQAGVQNPLMQLLLDFGADVNHPNGAGNSHATITACLANGRPEAAAFLAERGAALDLEGAAGIGRLDIVKAYFDESGNPKPGVTGRQVNAAFHNAIGWGHSRELLEFFLARGMDLSWHGGDGQTAAHIAVIFGRLDALRMLLPYHPDLEARNAYGGTVLGQAAWSAGHGGDPDVYIAIFEELLAAGARLDPRHVPVNEKVDAWLATKGSFPEPSWHWFGEGP